MVASIPLPSKEEIRSVVVYHPDTGQLFWLPRPVTMFEDGGHTAEHNCKIWNAANAFSEAFITIVNRYKVGGIFGQRYQAHRVIWKMVTGEDPDQIDHIDGDRVNNRWVNLRDVTCLENHRNAALQKRNKSGAPGVGWHKRAKKWRAFGMIKGKQIAVGYFHDLDEAIAARLKWQRENGFHENHGRKAA